MNARVPLLLLALAVRAAAGDPFQPSLGAELWGYGAGTDRVEDSPLNPDNRVAQLPGSQWTFESRVNLRLSRDDAEIVLRPRLLEQHNPGPFPDVDQAYLSQAFARLQVTGGLAFTGGRELLSWGPGNLRSPSNPLYYDSGRTDPLRDVPGVDLARLTWTGGPATLMVARELDVGHLDPAAAPQPVSLAKLDLRGRDTQFSVVVANQVWGAPFLGSYAQTALAEAWLVYGEIGSGRRRQDLVRATTSLLGATYTLVGGQTLGLEWLRDGHGYTRQAEAQYFAGAARIAGSYLAAPDGPLAPLQLGRLGQGLSQAPDPLGRDYGSLLWQSNLQETGHYWRLLWTANVRDHSSQVLAYGEKSLSSRCTAFAALTRNVGAVASEYASLFRGSLTLGLKCFIF